MKDEIKEISQNSNFFHHFLHIFPEKSQLKNDLLDYITTLQKENENLKAKEMINMELIDFERQVNQDLYYAILMKGFGSKSIISDIDFENDVFKISPYDWNEPENPEPNFIHKPSGFKLWWYKYPLRSPKVNFNITHEEFSCILYDCVNSISKMVKWEIDKFWESNGAE